MPEKNQRHDHEKREGHVDRMIEWLQKHRDEIDKAEKVKVELNGAGTKVAGSYTVFGWLQTDR